MKIRSAQDVLDIVRRRGMWVKVDPGPPPMPILVKPCGVPDAHVTDALMAALKAWRLEIIDLVLHQQHAGTNGVAS